MSRATREIVVEARTVLTDGVRRIGDEVRNSLDFHVMQEGSSPVERVVLTGPAVAIPGFAEQIGQQIGLTVEVGLVSEAKAGGFGGIDAGRLSVAAGLTRGGGGGMKAVNLIPRDARRGGMTPSLGSLGAVSSAHRAARDCRGHGLVLRADQQHGQLSARPSWRACTSRSRGCRRR